MRRSISAAVFFFPGAIFTGEVQAGEFKYSFSGVTSIIEGPALVAAPDLILGAPGPVKFNIFLVLTSRDSQEEIDAAFEIVDDFVARQGLKRP